MPIELSEQEKIVLNIVIEYLNNNRYFNMEKILSFINARFRMMSININNRGIEEILKSLVNKNLIVEGSKLTSQNLLKNEKRRKIYDFIVQNPGTYFNKIIRELKISNHVVVWHLNMLLKFDFIKSESIEQHEVYFDSNFDLKRSKFTYFSSKEKSKQIITYLKNNDIGITKTQISADLKIHYNTVSKYLEFLEKIEIIIKKTYSNKTLYFLNENLIEI
ncbi:MAG: hypothetical protein ACFFEN_13450 [Candidatus Thorarchaeota archaeon]